jgi:ATP-dependent Lhr-like helicase
MLKRLTFWSQQLGISVEVRHGDTEMKTRRKQARQPPQLLVTTPETLQAILPGSQMRQHLANVQAVVVDEVHDLAESKRGVQLSLGLERLLEVTRREFQRVGLSATVGNPAEVAQFVSGTNRPIHIIQAVLAKSYRTVSSFLRLRKPILSWLENWKPALKQLPVIRRLNPTSSTPQVHADFCEQPNRRRNAWAPLQPTNRPDVAVHHGSLSKEERVRIEDAFKAGTLKALICTSTLELGIDVGSVNLAVQYMSPRQVSSLIQRVGRSGHSLQRLSEGVIVTVYPDDTLESVAAVENAVEGKLEPVLLHENALDVLAHQLAGLIMDKQTLSTEQAAEIVRRAYLYRNLTEKQLFSVIYFLDSLNKIRLEQEAKILRKTGRTREYYYSNLSMIPDERRYPVINILTTTKSAR